MLEDCLNLATLQVLNPVEGWEVLYEQGLDLEWDWEFLWVLVFGCLRECEWECERRREQELGLERELEKGLELESVCRRSVRRSCWHRHRRC